MIPGYNFGYQGRDDGLREERKQEIERNERAFFFLETGIETNESNITKNLVTTSSKPQRTYIFPRGGLCMVIYDRPTCSVHFRIIPSGS